MFYLNSFIWKQVQIFDFETIFYAITLYRYDSYNIVTSLEGPLSHIELSIICYLSIYLFSLFMQGGYRRETYVLYTGLSRMFYITKHAMKCIYFLLLMSPVSWQWQPHSY